MGLDLVFLNFLGVVVTKAADSLSSPFRSALTRSSRYWHASSYVSESFVVRLSTTLSREVRKDARKKAAFATGELASRWRIFSRLCSVSAGESAVHLMSLAQRTLYLLI